MDAGNSSPSQTRRAAIGFKLLLHTTTTTIVCTYSRISITSCASLLYYRKRSKLLVGRGTITLNCVAPTRKMSNELCLNKLPRSPFIRSLKVRTRAIYNFLLTAETGFSSSARPLVTLLDCSLR